MNNKGQSIFEFLFFFPFMMLLYLVVLKVGTSINGAINQQKVTRGYVYTLLLNDSNIQTNSTLAGYTAFNVISSGIYALGWATRLEGESPIATCYSMPSLLGTDIDEKCEERQENRNTNFIRVKTVYGLCSENFYAANGNFYRGNNLPGFSVVSASESSCLNLK